MAVHRLINDFTAGEVSPLAEHRVDVERQRATCRRLRNFVPRVYGGVFRRPGTEYIGAVRDYEGNDTTNTWNPKNSRSRLIPFNFAPDERYVVELGDRSIEVWSAETETTQVVETGEYLFGTGEAIDQYTPYLAAELFDIQFVQVNNFIFFAHPNHYPHALARYYNFTNNRTEFLFYSMASKQLSEPLEGEAFIFNDRLPIEVNTSSEITAAITGGNTLTMSVDYFTDPHADWVLPSEQTNAESGLQFKVTTNLFEVSSITSDTVAAGTGTNTGATADWSVTAWNGIFGFPRSVAFHSQRLWFGGNKRYPTTVWGSEVGNFHNFRQGTADSNPVSFVLAADEGAAIQGMVADNAGLTVFTHAETWSISGSGSPITPSNVQANRQSGNGAAFVQPRLINDAHVYVDRGRQKVRELAYVEENQSWQAADLTIFAEHLVRKGVRQIAYQQNPEPVMWAVTNDDRLLSMSYSRSDAIVAWAEHPTGTTGAPGVFESVCVVYGDDYEADQVWVVVKRTINGTAARYVERFDPEWFTKLEAPSDTNTGLTPATNAQAMIYVDSAVAQTGASSTSWSGFIHLEGESLSILADGAYVGEKTVSSGSITLDNAASTVVAGLRFDSELQPGRTELLLEDGTGQTRKWLTNRVVFQLWETLGAQFTDDRGFADAVWQDVWRGEQTALTSGETPNLIAAGRAGRR